jgi:FAD/FMN-containing dehydrogenase
MSKNSCRFLGNDFRSILAVIAVSAALAAFPSHASSSSPGFTTSEDQALLQEAHDELARISQRSSCSGVKLTKTCGNAACEPEEGEDATTCALDCAKDPVKSFDSQVVCRQVQKLVIPKNIREIQKAIREARGHRQRIRVIGKAHSFNPQICTDGVAISTEKLNRILGIEKMGAFEVVRVEPSVVLGDLTEWLHRRGKSLGFAIPAFREVSIAGAVATGSHGSSPHQETVISSRVEAVTLIDSKGVVREFSSSQSNPDVLRALRTHLGVMGVIVELKLRVEPQFNLRMRFQSRPESELFQPQGAIQTVQECDFGQILWFPKAKKYFRMCGQKTEKESDPGATSIFLKPDVPGLLTQPIQLALHYGTCHKKLNCILEKLRFFATKFQPPYQRESSDGKLEFVDDLVGPSHRMITSELSSQQSLVRVIDWEIAIPAIHADDLLAYLKRAFQELKICSPVSGLSIRYARVDQKTWVGHTVALGKFRPGDVALLVEILVYSPLGQSEEEILEYQKPYRELISSLMTRFEGRAHWGKNQDWIFQLQRELGTYGENQRIFKKIMTEMDPNKLFQNAFTQNALGL